MRERLYRLLRELETDRQGRKVWRLSPQDVKELEQILGSKTKTEIKYDRNRLLAMEVFIVMAMDGVSQNKAIDQVLKGEPLTRTTLATAVRKLKKEVENRGDWTTAEEDEAAQK